MWKTENYWLRWGKTGKLYCPRAKAFILTEVWATFSPTPALNPQKFYSSLIPRLYFKTKAPHPCPLPQGEKGDRQLFNLSHMPVPNGTDLRKYTAFFLDSRFRGNDKKSDGISFA